MEQKQQQQPSPPPPNYKLSVLVLPTQYGKTFQTLAYMDRQLMEDVVEGRSLHIVHTMNTLLNNAQFSQRLMTIETAQPGSVWVLSSIKDKQFNHVSSLPPLVKACRTSNIRVVVMCGNITRFKDSEMLTEMLNEKDTPIKRVFVYYDELHTVIEQLRSKIEHLHSMSILHGILAMTASPDRLWKEDNPFWQQFYVADFGTLTNPYYCGVESMNYVPITLINKELVTSAIERVLRKYRTQILAPGARVFLPAANAMQSHDEIKEIVLELAPNAVVVVLNSKQKNLIWKGGSQNIQGDQDELGNQIAKIMTENNLLDCPLVVTGFNCVGIGQTITSQALGSFSAAVFVHDHLDPDASYQLFGRITGTMKLWTTYRPTVVYCTTQFHETCKEMESAVYNLVENFRGQVVDRVTYRQVMLQIKNEFRRDDGVAAPHAPKPKKGTRKIKQGNHGQGTRVKAHYIPLREQVANFFGRRSQPPPPPLPPQPLNGAPPPTTKKGLFSWLGTNNFRLGFR